MKQHSISQFQNQPSSAGKTPVATDPNPAGNDFSAFGDEVARRAYFSYVNQGSKPGHDVQHWLEAEAHELAERNRTRTHGFHNNT